MKLSIITVNYNNLSGLQLTADSVFSQKMPPGDAWEWIIVDGASKDGSAQFIQAISHHTAYAVSEPDGGIYEAMNKAVEHCRGEYCLFLNSGDILYDSDTVKKCLDIVYGNQNIDVFRFAVTMELNGRQQDVCCPVGKIDGINLFSSSIAHQGTLIKTSLLRKYPYDTRFRIVADAHFFMRIYLYENIKDLCRNDILSRYDCSGVSSTKYLQVMEEKRAAFTDLTSPVIYDDYARFCYGKSFYEKMICKLRKNRFFYTLSLAVLSLLYILYCGVSLIVNIKFFSKKLLKK